MFCQHIAVISSETAAGYGDFCNQLADNPYGFRFETRLFPATMQGDGIEQSIIAALESIWRKEEGFDCVVIIRGGGATADLSGFDTLALAENVANFPIPIITGIGHDRDESILDMVSHLRVKTPTAAAAFLISHLKEVSDAIDDSQKRLAQYAKQMLSTFNTQLQAISEVLPRLFSTVKIRQEARLDTLQNRLVADIRQKITEQHAQIYGLEQRMPILLERRMMKEHHAIEVMEQQVKSVDPALLLRRGYSITLKDGRVLRDATALRPGDEIETRLANGTVRSTVK